MSDVDAVTDVVSEVEEEQQLNRNKGDKIEHKYELSDPSTFPDDDLNRTIGSIGIDDIAVGLFQFCEKLSSSL